MEHEVLCSQVSTVPTGYKMGAGEQGGGGCMGAASKEEGPVSVSFLHRLLVLSWERNPKKGHCYWGYETSGRQDEHKDAAVQSGI